MSKSRRPKVRRSVPLHDRPRIIETATVEEVGQAFAGLAQSRALNTDGVTISLMAVPEPSDTFAGVERHLNRMVAAALRLPPLYVGNGQSPVPPPAPVVATPEPPAQPVAPQRRRPLNLGD